MEEDEWKPVIVGLGLQEFYDHWCKAPHSFGLPKRFPYTLSLGGSETCQPVGLKTTLDNEIVVTKSYHDTYYRILGLRAIEKGREGGVVLTGQPGVGMLQ